MAFSPPGFGGDAPDGSPDFTGASVLGLVAAGGVYTLLNPLICTTLTAAMQKLRFPLRVYRGLILSDFVHLDLGIPGLHWTPNRRIANNFATGEHGSAMSGSGEPALLTGVIERPEDVNWQRTLTDWLIYTAGVFEFAPRNLGTDTKGRLVLLDPLYNREKLHERQAEAIKKREARGPGFRGPGWRGRW